MNRKLFVTVLMLGYVVAANAHFMSSVWPQKNMASHSAGDPTSNKRVLIAGLSSPFKDTIASRIVDSLNNDGVYVRLINLKDLNKEDPNKWAAVLIINTCIAWDMDSKAKKFVKKYPDYSGFITLIASGDPDGCGDGKKLPKNIDAIASASQADKIPALVSQFLALLRQKLEKVPAASPK
ncbi:MAG: hypothetical protein MUF22_02880 [Chitinispirillaceae bacterium]|nr:hypothetical protein [Chitinispirillaceae bacterium]